MAASLRERAGGSLDVAGPAPAFIARRGDRWRFNVFRVERPGGKEHPEAGAVEVAWSDPHSPSFHVPAAFRDFVFAGP